MSIDMSRSGSEMVFSPKSEISETEDQIDKAEHRVLSVSEQNNLANKLYKEGGYVAIANQLEELPDINISHDEVIRNLLEKGECQTIIDNLDKFTKLSVPHDNLAEAIIKRKQGDLVLKNIEKFDLSVSHDDLAKKMIEYGQGDNVLKYLNISELSSITVEKLPPEQTERLA